MATAAGAPMRGAGRIDVRARGWFNPGLDYQAYMVPGILVLLVTMVATALGSMNIVREKELGTLEQLNVTPVTRAEFIASKLIPFWLIGLGVLAFGLAVARVAYDIPMRGNLALVFLGAAVYLLVALSIGLWISTIVETQQQAMFVTFSINMVYMLMSGLFTPILSMPRWAQWIAQLSPVKHFIVVIARGAGEGRRPPARCSSPSASSPATPGFGGSPRRPASTPKGTGGGHSSRRHGGSGTQGVRGCGWTRGAFGPAGRRIETIAFLPGGWRSAPRRERILSAKCLADQGSQASHDGGIPETEELTTT